MESSSNRLFTPYQVQILNHAFALGPFLGNRAAELAQTTGLTEEQVRNWFRRRRSGSRITNARVELVNAREVIGWLNALVKQLRERMTACPACSRHINHGVGDNFSGVAYDNFSGVAYDNFSGVADNSEICKLGSTDVANWSF